MVGLSEGVVAGCAGAGMPSQYEDIAVPVFDAREEGWLSDCDGKREEEFRKFRNSGHSIIPAH